MSQRSILITGASSGIGHHAAHALHKRGWQVIAAARKEGDVSRLRDEGLNAVQLDYADEASIPAAFEATLEQTGGGLDALFNNGAYGQVGALEDISTEHMRAQFEANFFGIHRLTQLALPVMRAQGSGRIVQCSSVLGFIAAPYRGPYVASKFALEGYSDSLRSEVSRFGIKVISIQPGPITSRFRANALAVFQRTVDADTSAYADDYAAQLKRLTSRDKAAFELGPQAVTRVLIKALESANPKPTYRVTTPTHLMALVKRLAPTRWQATMLARARDK
ncbi:MAG: SDR family NAD(P)-dependent oxidoreductase [Rhizobiales bacterium]|nr:SDR family NAD(P)-dependent oxidoreductase [Hyphomicrobiales bacterium]MBO6699730.1 SDR family NAD(P)-dependent oxidoreductase [Hyphomicrobiales bacterium]MBO6737268.1 SDR family NAD(P)-dependent oxidoreductase [Hyphomicrobiales bacterium]MBO6911658.1 SDR family NAD(P)-dependent oxidoreductase [Hyphomicrobiales bacterium]MBO6954920.1 SDR family NAD(P)-dependent oxidoreductase [Hyphomicrobiales bacterium]